MFLIITVGGVLWGNFIGIVNGETVVTVSFWSILLIVAGVIFFAIYTIKSNTDEWEKIIRLVLAFTFAAILVCNLFLVMAGAVFSAWQ
jgi:hypothetical protein